MDTTVKFGTSDYMAIARTMIDNRPDEPRAFEVTHKLGKGILRIEALYEYDYRDVRGGSFEDYQFETLSEITAESFDIISYEFLDADGEEVDTDFTINKLLDILN